ncbi:MAG: hypothetical protein M1815_000226 [Lichina confinis]|nr:MAG: hypothetical protein M1815_000226 [Lichina confinis]
MRLAQAVALALALALSVFVLLQRWITPVSTTNDGWRSPVLGSPNGSPVAPTTTTADATDTGDLYLLGVGKADITGPVVELNFMGYADAAQVGTGLRQRLYSRAFIVGDVDRPSDRFVYVVLDIQSGDTAVRYGVLEGLAKLGPEYAMYGQSNIAVVGTHSHSGPGAWDNYLLPQITSQGFDKQSYGAIVDGTVRSIVRAHESLSPGHLVQASIRLPDASINRSPYSYLANPESERQQYEDDVDRNMTLLRFRRASDCKTTGVLNWFAVHGTSMYGNNTLVTADNKGVAAYLLESHARGRADYADGFVAGFSQSNEGDVSPNVLGAWCEDGSGKPCDFQNSTCKGMAQPCHGRGPRFRADDTGTESCFEIGRRQFEAARSILGKIDDDGVPVRGSTVKSLHNFVDYSDFTFTLPNGTSVSTCYAALGYSFAAGTTDGPGGFDFKQNNSGSPDANPLWGVVSRFIHAPAEEQRRCQSPKPILLDVGAVNTPYAWAPNIVDIQMFRAGQFIVVVSPGELTTMAGRRWREAIKAEAEELSLADVDVSVVIGGPANSYTHYITTEEEYGIQRYEGASTLYGPHTLNAYINLTRSYLGHLHPNSTKSPPPSGPLPPNNVNASLSFIAGVIYDLAPLFGSFGDVVADVSPKHRLSETVNVTFIGANPRNNLRLEGTYAAVERRNEDGSWNIVRDDGDWSLVFRWKRKSRLLGTSEVTVQWEVEHDAPVGTYRIIYNGDSKAPMSGSISSFQGRSSSFELVP